MIPMLPARSHPASGAPLTDYGPNSEAVQRLIDAARRIASEDAHAILRLRIQFVGLRSADDAERAALRRALTAAKRSRRLDAYVGARHAAAEAFREARRGEVGPWLGVSAAIANASGALVLGDLLELEDFELLYRPWRSAIHGARLVPLGPGQTAFGMPPRRRPGSLIGS